MSDAAIRTRALRKVYTADKHAVPAVDGLDLEVRPGEFFGLLGPNGAGKSTTIGMLTTRIVPTGGTATVAGYDVTRDPVAVRQRIGVVTQANTMDRAVNLLENLEYRGRFFGMSGRESRRRAMELLERFGLAEVAQRLDDHVSGGQSKRAMVCRALMHRPDVLFLDEPTAAIDPQARRNLWELLRELNAAGQTILLTTHYLEEAEELCGRIAVVDHGKVLACDTVAGIKASSAADSVITVTYDAIADAVVETVGKLRGVRRVEADGPELRVHAAAPADGLLGELVTVGLNHGLAVRNASTLPPSLETAFLNLTGREYRE
ncbi:ABC-2 type transport system ATP-binding protein [Streptomyces misionensis]|uniref:ABC-2 type transport system ATP-binding protein n=1 Tax=Streptomyces misionensis TaxID=67331 RepID=A0A1H4I9X4_9ACTN|nr:ATP-binding cassette domain-containing protein [Streptomyces misionensis]SEB30894.1 ABC-2 type transport system ATP-binding protein [Streptomyces misionensis]